METYTLLREIADSWVLLAMFIFFVSVGIWACLPSQNKARADASMIPFRNEDQPCPNPCDTCSCKTVVTQLKGQIDA